MLKDIPKYETFNNEEQACVYGIKAAFLMVYSPFENTLISIDCAKRAFNLDGTVGWYFFLAGKGLHRHRQRYSDAYPGTEEFYFMKQAKQIGFRSEEVEMFLIEMYSEMASVVDHKLQEEYYKETEIMCRYLVRI